MSTRGVETSHEHNIISGHAIPRQARNDDNL